MDLRVRAPPPSARREDQIGGIRSSIHKLLGVALLVTLGRAGTTSQGRQLVRPRSGGQQLANLRGLLPELGLIHLPPLVHDILLHLLPVLRHHVRRLVDHQRHS